MKLSKSILALAAAAAMAPAMAGAFTLDFEGVTSFQSINGFYNGGTDSFGASGANYGASFSSDLLALSNDELGPYFSHAPTPGTVMFSNAQTQFVNVAAGFVDMVSFYYSSVASTANAINVYSGLNGTGDLLGSFSLNKNAQAGCSDTGFCNFEKTSISFDGVGMSMSFVGPAGEAAYDNVTMISAVPEPSTYALMALGLGAVGFIARRRRSV